MVPGAARLAGCRLAPSLTGLLSAGIGVFDASLRCGLLSFQGASFTGTSFEFSPALLTQFGK